MSFLIVNRVFILNHFRLSDKLLSTLFFVKTDTTHMQVFEDVGQFLSVLYL